MNLSYDIQNNTLGIYIGQYNNVNSQIIRLYDTLDEIRHSIINVSHRSPIHQRILDILVEQLNQIYSQMDRLYTMLDEIRQNINRVLQNTNRNNRQTNQRSRTNVNNVSYDYQNPINPSIYANTNNRTNNSTNFGRQVTDLLSSFLNTTVTIRPTNEQLETASRLVRYGDIERPLSESCPISMDRFNVDDQVRQIHHCGHLFVPSQFDEWFQSNVRCPVCRFDVRNHTPTPNTTPTPTPTPNTTPTIPTLSNPTFDMSNNEIIYDITNNNNLLDSISGRLFESLFNPLSNSNNNDRFVFDPSNNILMYETIIRRNPENTNPDSSSANQR